MAFRWPGAETRSLEMALHAKPRRLACFAWSGQLVGADSLAVAHLLAFRHAQTRFVLSVLT